MNLNQADQEYVWHPFDAFRQLSQNIVISKGEGAYLITADGRRIYDGISSWWVNLHGHAHPTIAKAIAEQAATLEQVIFSGFTHEPAIKLASRLAAKLPGGLQKIFFSDNGSTAVEVALKLSLQYNFNTAKKKSKLIAIRGAYHGDTFGAMAVGERGIFTKPFEEKLFQVEFVSFPDGQNDQQTLQEMEQILKGGEVAAFIYEPLLQGSAGMRKYSAATLDEMMRLAKQYNAICIADEVFTGFGRTGKWFASDYLVQKPDIICLSKGITGGFLPLGVTACSAALYESFQSGEAAHVFYHGHSYTANPLACAAANASWDLMEKAETWQQIEMLSTVNQRFGQKIADLPSVGRVNIFGTIFSVEVLGREESSYTNALRERLYKYFLERNTLLRPLGNIIYLVPPYVTTEVDLKNVHNLIEEVLRDPSAI